MILEWFGQFCLLFPFPYVMTPKWAEPVKIEVMSICGTWQLPWILYLPHPGSAEREAKHLWSTQSLGIAMQLCIKEVGTSKVQYNWPAAGPNHRVTLPASPSCQQWLWCVPCLRAVVPSITPVQWCQLWVLWWCSMKRRSWGCFEEQTLVGCCRELAHRLV